MKSVLYSNPFVKKEIVNLHHEKFDKPAIVIANHTSFLDTLATGMVTHRVIYLVNDWVYKSPIFGGVVRLAGYYPVSKGLEGGVEHLRKRVDHGYLLMVFPEGTRSEDNDIKRFHKGAFYLAEQFNLDILPIYIHGNSETLPKGDHIIYDENKEVIYVGETINGPRRLAEHFGYDKSKAFHKGQFKKAYCKEFWSYEVIETTSKQERLIKEIELEFKHEPKYNKRWQTK